MLPFLKSNIVVLNIISYRGHFSGIVLWPSVIVYELGAIGFQVSMSYERGGHNPLFKLVGKNDVLLYLIFFAVDTSDFPFAFRT
jgi:hypothetical protein